MKFVHLSGWFVSAGTTGSETMDRGLEDTDEKS